SSSASGLSGSDVSTFRRRFNCLRTRSFPRCGSCHNVQKYILNRKSKPAGTPRVQLVRIPAAADSDTATQQTIDLMCRCIRESSEDPMIRLAAQYAVHHFGAGSSDPAMQAWAVFWFVKHQVKFVVDEAPMFRLGEPNQQDLLISPAV